MIVLELAVAAVIVALVLAGAKRLDRYEDELDRRESDREV